MPTATTPAPSSELIDVPSRPEDPSRTGTLWVGATGVSLLLAAAAVLTAVRWGDIGQSAKLGGFVAITLALLFGGRRLQRSIPLTGRAIFHLGALLIPLDMAAVAVLAERTWQEALLLTSFTAVISWFALVRVDASPVLEWASRASVVFGAAGVAAVTPLSTALVLAAVALVGALVTIAASSGPGRDLAATLGVLPSGRSATVWTLVAGLLPLAATQPWPTQLVASADDLGFGPSAHGQLVGAGIIATVVALGLARWRPTLERGWMVVVLGVVSAVTVPAYATHPLAWAFSLAVFFVVAEVVALVTRHDPAWKQIAAVVLPAIEFIAALGTAVVLVDAVLVDPSGGVLMISAALLGIGWLTADVRRLREPNDWLVGLIYGADWRPATFLVPTSAVAAVAASSAPGGLISSVLLAVMAWAFVTARRDASFVAVAASVVAAAITPVGWAGVAVFMFCAVVLAFGSRLAVASGQPAGAFALSSLAAVFGLGLVLPLGGLVSSGAVMTVVVVVAWLLGWVASSEIDEPVTFPPRAVSVATLFAAVSGLNPIPSLIVVATVTVLALADAWWAKRWWPTAIAGVAVGLAGLPVGELVGFSIAESGVMMAAASMVAVGLQIALPQRLELAFAALAVTLAVVGVAVTAGTAMLAPALMLIGGAVVLFGAATLCNPVIGAGALCLIVGTWMQLAIWEVTWLEAYLALPALAALYAGSTWHRRGLNSWVAYAPTIALVGAVAAVDRIGGGSAWHAVIAGAVGVFAVVAGGVWRLSGPLITGTALIAAVAIYESLGPGSRVPTWGWLAFGGVVLLGAAVLMERAETTPLEQGQRVLNVLVTRFT